MPGLNCARGHLSRDARLAACNYFTRGGPWMKGWENVAYAGLWVSEFERAVQSGDDLHPGAPALSADGAV